MADVKETVPLSPSTLSFEVEITAEELAKAVEDWPREMHSQQSASAAK